MLAAMRISGAESQIMEAVWQSSPRTADDLVAEVGTAQGWGEATVKTQINRLLKKGVLSSARADGRARYSPLVSRADYLTGESQGLLDRLFGGEVAPLVAHLAQHRPLSADEVTRLKRLIETLERDG